MNPSLLAQTFRLTRVLSETTQVQFRMSIDPASPVFEGHFPGNPVLPGVIMVEAVRQGLSEVMGETLRLHASQAIKFLAVINPTCHSEVMLSCSMVEEGAGVKVDAQIFHEATVFFKIKAVFRPE